MDFKRIKHNCIIFIEKKMSGNELPKSRTINFLHSTISKWKQKMFQILSVSVRKDSME
jgi:hypothetical protein